MTIATAFRLPVLAIIASAQTAQMDVVNVLRNMDVTAGDMSATEFASLQAETLVPALSLQDALAATPVAGDDVYVDIWERLRAGFAIPDTNNPAVQAHLDSFRGQAYFVERILRRSEPYLYYVLSRVEQRGMPAELALLPVIESAYDPYALSPAGAVGIWQFMPATADAVGLQRDWWFDGRRDIVAATEAALDYLSALHDRYGDWRLALAAYNAGSARVSRAIRENREQGRAVDFRHLPLPEETRNYVPKLIALRSMISDPAAYGINLPELANNRYFTSVDTGTQIDLQVAARLSGATLDELQRLNPGLTRSITPPGGSHRLLVPSASVALFRNRLARLPEEQRVQSVMYRVQPGDTLSGIAHDSRTSVAHLRRINQLEGSRIIAGSLLIVPMPEQDEHVALQDSPVNG